MIDWTADRDRKVLYLLEGKKNNYYYDPFDLLRKCEESALVSNARELANAIIPLPLETKDPFWINTARNILTGAIVYSVHHRGTFIPTMKSIVTMSINEVIKKIVQDDLASACIDRSIGQIPQTLAGVYAELHDRLVVFATDSLLWDALSPSEDGSKLPIQWEDLEEKDIFIRIDQSRMGQWGRVLRLLLVQLIRTLERRPEKNSPKGTKIKPTLLLLDEFPQYGKIEEFTSSMKVLRSKNVTFCLFCQSLADLDEIYGKDTRRTILDNCPFQAIMGAHDHETQEYFSQRVGTVKVVHEGASEIYDVGGNQTGFSRNATESEEPAIRAHEFGGMEQIVLIYPGPGVYIYLNKNLDYRCSPPQEQPENEEKDT